MKPAAAFAVGLWTGALVMTAVGLVYYRLGAGTPGKLVLPAADQFADELAAVKQDNARIAAEAQRLRETVAELRSRPAAEAVRRIPFRRGPVAPDIEPWILETTRNPDAQSLPKLEQAALQNNLDALDAVAVLADRDKAETLMRICVAPALNEVGKQRAAQLLGATVELNPRAEEFLLAQAGTAPAWLIWAAAGLETPGFATRLARGTGITPPPLFKPDYGLRLRMLTNLRAAVTDENLAARLDQARAKITQRASVVEQP